LLSSDWETRDRHSPNTDKTKQHLTVRGTSNQHSSDGDTTTPNSPVRDTTNQQLPGRETTYQHLPIGKTTNQHSPVRDLVNQYPPVRDTTYQHLQDRTNQNSPVKDRTNHHLSFRDQANQYSPFRDKTNQISPFRDTAILDFLNRSPTNLEVSKEKKSESEETTSQKQDTGFFRRTQPDIRFSPIHSPDYAPDYFSFTDLANRWMADIKSACDAKRETAKGIPSQEQQVTASICENILENKSKPVSDEHCQRNVLNKTYTVNTPCVDSSIHLNNVKNPFQNLNEMDMTSNTDIPCINNEEKSSQVLNYVSKENARGPNKTPQLSVHTQALVNRRLSYSQCVSNPNSIPPLRVSEENKENQPTVPEGREPVQQPIKIKISLNSLRNSPDVQLVRSHRKQKKSHQGTSSSVYCAVQQSDTKLKLCKVKVTPVQQVNVTPVQQVKVTPVQPVNVTPVQQVNVTPVKQSGDLRHYWKVRKSGGCRLVFSAEKRKASDDGDDIPTASKRKRIDVM
jgi:hypothetical protein